MKRKITIEYSWWRSGGGRIKPSHVEALEETAMERIQEQMGRGYTEGQLTDNIHMTPRDPMDGIDYSGYWKLEIDA